MIPTLKQFLQEQALLHRQWSHGLQPRHSSVCSECPMPGDTQSPPPLTTLNAPRAKCPQISSLNDSLVHSQTLASPVSHLTGSALSSMSHSQTPPMTSDDLASPAQPSSGPSVPSELLLIHCTRLFTLVNVLVFSYFQLITNASNQALCLSR
jgi:hypothetical protein